MPPRVPACKSRAVPRRRPDGCCTRCRLDPGRRRRPRRRPRPSPMRSASSCSCTGVGAAGGAHAMRSSPRASARRVWGRCCSTCSQRREALDRAQRLRHRAADATAPRRHGAGFGAPSPGSRIPAARLLRREHGRGGGARAAAESTAEVAAVVSRGGRPDLAGDRPAGRHRADAPRRRGGRRPPFSSSTRRPRCSPAPAPRPWCPGATHLFEEPGALEEVARLAADWFTRHFRRGDADA